jgi:hypothetical protein
MQANPDQYHKADPTPDTTLTNYERQSYTHWHRKEEVKRKTVQDKQPPPAISIDQI